MGWVAVVVGFVVDDTLLGSSFDTSLDNVFTGGNGEMSLLTCCKDRICSGQWCCIGGRHVRGKE